MALRSHSRREEDGMERNGRKDPAGEKAAALSRDARLLSHVQGQIDRAMYLYSEKLHDRRTIKERANADVTKSGRCKLTFQPVLCSNRFSPSRKIRERSSLSSFNQPRGIASRCFARTTGDASIASSERHYTR